MKGLLLPKLDLHRSERDPMIGVRKNPINGDKHQIRVMCSWSTPEKKLHITISKKVEFTFLYLVMNVTYYAYYLYTLLATSLFENKLLKLSNLK